MNEIKVNESGFKIGGVQIKNPIVSAPMAGVTDKAFRLIAESFDCGLVYTEMVSATALHYNSERTRVMMDLSLEQGPTALQIFGNEPKYMAEAAKAAEEEGAATIDINMGCPAPKVVKNMEGCALMKNPSLAANIAWSVVEAVSIPVMVKIRKGWDAQSVNAVKLARTLEECGVSAIAVHGRTRDQFYSGLADWDIITEVKGSVRIPVIGNGDVFEPADAARMLRETGCDAVMIGRGALGNPWLFKRAAHLLKTGDILPPPQAVEKISMIKHHLKLAIGFKGEQRALKEMRKHCAWYIKGLRDSTTIRELINQAKTEKELLTILDRFLKELNQLAPPS